MNIFSNSDINLVRQKAVDAINVIFKEHLTQPILFMTSGGSAFDLLEGIDSRFLGNNITISVLDERYSQDPYINNFVQLTKTNFYKRAKEKKCSFIDTRIIDNENLEQSSERFERYLLNWKSDNPEGYVFITQGIGTDGHTAGIMPFPENVTLFQELFEDATQWVAGYDADKKNEYSLRVTTTITFLKEIVNESIVYVIGENKKQILKKILQDSGVSGELAEIPGRVINEMKRVTLFKTE